MYSDFVKTNIDEYVKLIEGQIDSRITKALRFDEQLEELRTRCAFYMRAIDRWAVFAAEKNGSTHVHVTATAAEMPYRRLDGSAGLTIVASALIRHTWNGDRFFSRISTFVDCEPTRTCPDIVEHMSASEVKKAAARYTQLVEKCVRDSVLCRVDRKFVDPHATQCSDQVNVLNPAPA